MKQQDHTYFQNRNCPYFPCHAHSGETFNCLFCYCPLYALGDGCGGNYRYLENGVKDCSACLIPHSPGGYGYVLDHFSQVAELAKKNHREAMPGYGDFAEK